MTDLATKYGLGVTATATNGVLFPYFPISQSYSSGDQIAPIMGFGGYGGTLTSGTITYVPIIVTVACTIAAIVVSNHTSINGNTLRVGLYDSSGRRPNDLLAESAATAIADTNTGVYRSIALASPPAVAAGLYFAAAQANSNAAMYTIQFATGIPNGEQDFGRHSGLFTQSQAFGAFPATATPVKTYSPTLICAAYLEVQ